MEDMGKRGKNEVVPVRKKSQSTTRATKNAA